jgi:hypothetical protein
MIDQLVEADGHEVEEHDLGHRAVPAEGEADGRAEDRLLGDGRGPHPVGSVAGRQPGGRLEHPAGRVGDVLAEEDHLRVGGEGPVERGEHRGGHAHVVGLDAVGHPHGTNRPSENTSRYSSAGSGGGLA